MVAHTDMFLGPQQPRAQDLAEQFWPQAVVGSAAVTAISTATVSEYPVHSGSRSWCRWQIVVMRWRVAVISNCACCT